VSVAPSQLAALAAGSCCSWPLLPLPLYIAATRDAL
jgi:hypothetical protein